MTADRLTAVRARQRALPPIAVRVAGGGQTAVYPPRPDPPAPADRLAVVLVVFGVTEQERGVLAAGCWGCRSARSRRPTG